MSLVPVKEYADAAEMMAAYAARKRRLFPKLTVVSREAVGLPPPKQEPSVAAESSPEDVTDIPNFLALRPKATDWLDSAPKAAFRMSDASIILKLVCEHMGVSVRELKSDRRTRDVLRPRQIAFWLMRRCTKLSLPVMGRKLGGRDHTTALHSVRFIDNLRAENPEIRELTDMLFRKAEAEIYPDDSAEGEQ